MGTSSRTSTNSSRTLTPRRSARSLGRRVRSCTCPTCRCRALVCAFPPCVHTASRSPFETEKKIDMDRVYAVLNEASGVVVVDDTSKNLYPMPITASTKFDVEVGRLRANDVFGEYGLDMFVVGD